MAKRVRAHLTPVQVEARRAKQQRRDAARRLLETADRARLVESALARVRQARSAATMAELDHKAALRRRDVAVWEARQVGVSWGTLAREAGTSRQALMQRVGAVVDDRPASVRDEAPPAEDDDEMGWWDDDADEG